MDGRESSYVAVVGAGADVAPAVLAGAEAVGARLRGAALSLTAGP